MKVMKAASSEAELKYLYAALADFSRNGARAEYAAWLKTQGRKEDAQAVLATIDVFHSLDASPLEEFNSETPWARMIAIPLLKEFISSTLFVAEKPAPPPNISPQQLQNWNPTRWNFVRTSDPAKIETVMAVRDLAFRWLRPALSLSYAPAEKEPELGASYLWGMPDIPEGESWPLIRELSDNFNCKNELPQERHCAFVGQIAFADMQGTLLGYELPAEGGFAVFKIHEVTHLGVCETLLRPWNNNAPLKRHKAPQDLIDDKLGDSTNAPQPPHEITLQEVLSLPDDDGPYGKLMPDCGYGEKYHDTYSSLRDACDSDSRILGFGGYLRGTSGADPSPDAQSLRFAVLRLNSDVGIGHFSIPAADLKAGRLDRVKDVWNDWDS